jgi:DNA-binding transcriptional LysR family regulator
MDKVQNMRVFAMVAEMGSFTAAANQLDTTTGNVSRAITLLEEDLSTRLMHRTTRRLAMTDAGKRYYQRCKQILAELDYAEAEAREALSEPRGILRIHTIPGLGQAHIAMAAISFRDRFPAVSIELTFSQTLPDLVADQLDVSIVVVQSLPDSGYVSQVIGTSRSVLVASPDYLRRRGMPQTVDDLADHACVRLVTTAFPENEWVLSGENGDFMFSPPESYICVNDHAAMSIALRSGAGIGLLAGYSVIDDLRSGNLVRVLPTLHTHSRNIYVTYPSRQYLDAKVRAFVDHIRQDFGEKLAEQDRELDVYTKVACAN